MKKSDGSATTWAVAIIFVLLLSFTLIISFASIIGAQNAVANAADLVAMSGCDTAVKLSELNQVELVSCHDDGVEVLAETRKRINLPLRVKSLYAHARAHSAHEM